MRYSIIIPAFIALVSASQPESYGAQPEAYDALLEDIEAPTEAELEHWATADTKELYAAASSLADEVLASASGIAATATDSAIPAAYTSLKEEISSANAVAAGYATFSVEPYPTATGGAHDGYAVPSAGHPAPTGTAGNGSGDASPDAPIEQVGNGAAAMGVPVLGALALAALAAF